VYVEEIEDRIISCIRGKDPDRLRGIDDLTISAVGISA
jgi:hypothetical protein